MFIDHPAFINPQNEGYKLWRYLESDKLFHLLESSCIYFCRADYFQKEDQFEGSYPRREYEFQVKHDNSNEPSRRLYEINSKDTFINCWHFNENEDLAMWKLYGKDEKGIAIQTNISNFKNAFNNCSEEIFGGQIDYIDYETEPFYNESSHNYFRMNAFTLFIHKRKIYKYEKEYRAIYHNSNGSQYSGFNIKVDLNKLISKIYLSPFSSESEYLKVANKLKELNISIPICYSSFKAQPYY